MNCLIYARVSTERQAEKDLSIPAQLQAMREHAQRQGWTVVEEFVEPGLSAWHGERPTLKALLARCQQQPKVDVVLIHKLDRFARSLKDYVTITAHLKQLGVKLASVAENIDESVAGQLLRNILATMAEHYSVNLSEEAKKGMRMKVERGGWPHQPPRGYKVFRDGPGPSHIVIDETVAPLVRLAFERYATGFVSLKRLSREMGKEGLRSRSGRLIAPSYWRELLENPFYVGRLRWNGRDFSGKHAPLIEESLFSRVQDVLRARHKNAGDKGKHRFMLRGVAFCGECGARLTAERHDEWSYYRCVRHTVSKALCAAPFSNADRTHGEVATLLSRLHVSQSLKDAITVEADQYALARVERARARVNSIRMRLVRMEERELRIGEAFARGDMSDVVYRNLATKMRSDATTLRSTLNEANVNPKAVQKKIRDVLALVVSVNDIYATMTDENRHCILRILFRRITVKQGRILEYSLHQPFERLLSEEDSTPNLDSKQVVRAIENILEFDTTAFESVLKERKAA